MKKVLSIFLGLFLVFVIATPTSVSAGNYAVLYFDSQLKYTEAFNVLDIVNAERTTVGAAPLVMDKELLNAAMLRAEETAIYWSHTRPTGQGPFTAINKIVGSRGENIAAGQGTATGVMNSWMNSPGHKANILKTEFESVGIGCVVVNGTTYWVQLFGSSNLDEASPTSYSNRNNEAAVETNPNGGFYTPRLTVAKSTLNIGETTTLTYRTENVNSWMTNIIKAKSFTFESSNNSVCTVDANGRITARNGGTTTISVYPKGFSGARSTINITVNSKPTSTPTPTPKPPTPTPTPRPAQTQTFTISYNANGGNGAPKAQIKTQGRNLKLSSSKPKRTGYTFKGWAESKSTSKVKYKAGATFTPNKNTTLYAVWTANKYTITYNKNGGRGKLSATKTTYAKNARLKTNTFKRSGHKFNGWTVYRRSDKKWLYVKGKQSGWYRKGKQPKGYKLQVYKNKTRVRNLTTKNNDRIIMHARWKKR